MILGKNMCSAVDCFELARENQTSLTCRNHVVQLFTSLLYC